MNELNTFKSKELDFWDEEILRRSNEALLEKMYIEAVVEMVKKKIMEKQKD